MANAHLDLLVYRFGASHNERENEGAFGTRKGR